jgi:hypothetical protein
MPISMSRTEEARAVEQPPPPGMSRWDGPAVAKKLNSSVYAVWRVPRREGIYPQVGIYGAS